MSQQYSQKVRKSKVGKKAAWPWKEIVNQRNEFQVFISFLSFIHLDLSFSFTFKDSLVWWNELISSSAFNLQKALGKVSSLLWIQISSLIKWRGRTIWHLMVSLVSWVSYIARYIQKVSLTSSLKENSSYCLESGCASCTSHGFSAKALHGNKQL